LIIVDTSALVTIFLREPEFERYLQCMAEHSTSWVPVPCYLEFCLLRQLGNDRREWIDQFLADRSMSIAAIEPQHGAIAADAASIYGKGSGHPAQLNFGDCLTYAVAKDRDLPLLFRGRDFQHTDIRPAIEMG
jgi:ribonuclease VapC